MDPPPPRPVPPPPQPAPINCVSFWSLANTAPSSRCAFSGAEMNVALVLFSLNHSFAFLLESISMKHNHRGTECPDVWVSSMHSFSFFLPWIRNNTHNHNIGGLEGRLSRFFISLPCPLCSRSFLTTPTHPPQARGLSLSPWRSLYPPELLPVSSAFWNGPFPFLLSHSLSQVEDLIEIHLFYNVSQSLLGAPYGHTVFKNELVPVHGKLGIETSLHKCLLNGIH